MEPNNGKYCVSNRNRFDRFGDDFCEEILQYLSYSDKIRLECVSKQWKSCVYRRQHVLDISYTRFSNPTVNGLPSNKLLSYYDENITELKNVSIIERVLQKCPQISEIRIRISSRALKGVSKLSYDQLLRIIADNCRNLSTVILYPRTLELDGLKYFGEKCGKTLKTLGIGFRTGSNFYGALKYFPSLLSINNLRLDEVIDAKQKDTILFPKLRKITDFTVYRSNELMDIFVDRYKNTLKVFSAGFVGSDCKPFILQVSQLTNLEKLRLTMFNNSNNNLSRFTDGFAEIGANCVQIKHLSINITNDDQNNVLLSALLDAINSFIHLKYLYLNLPKVRMSFDERNVSINLLKNCTQLRRITIISIIDNRFFANVYKHVSQIEFVEIETTECITDVMLDNLAKLEKLRAIFIKSESNVISDTGICNLIDNCTQFRSFTFNPCPQYITGKAINKFVEISRIRPKINFSHIFRCCYCARIKSLKSLARDSRKYFGGNLTLNVQFVY